MNIIRTVSLDRISRRKDKSVAITFITDNEQTSEQLMELDKELDQRGVLLFKPNGLLTDKEVEAVETSNIPKEGTTQSQKIRQRIWTLWKYSKSEMNERDFYHHTTEQILVGLQNKIDKLK